MAEKIPSKEPVGRLEILDLNHRGLYGRFLMASQAQETEVPNIINPATPVEFNFAEDKVLLDKRDYNPVFQNLSLKERQDQWKEIPLFDNAYKQWRTEFTGFMINIQDPQRALALKAILANNKEAKDFTIKDADDLFNEFCRGKSDITNFLKRVTANLARASDGKIDSANLKSLLPHLEWIASGLFGRQTAGMSARLVDLESQLYNNHAEVLAAFTSDKERIRILQPDERKVLSDLYSLIPQEKRNSIRGAVVIPTPPAAPTSPEDKDEL